MSVCLLTRRGLALGAGLGLLSPGFARAQSRLRVRYARPPREIDTSAWFPLTLLRLVLEASEEPFLIEPSQSVVLQERAVRELAGGSDTVDLVWTVTSAERERQMRAVRIPIDRGLFGWRLLLVRRGESSRFAGVRDLEGLRRFVMLQGDEWPDTAVLRDNQLRVASTASWRRLFEMLGEGAGDAFPRSVEEIWWELKNFAPRFEVEPHLALRYPSAMYYFTSRGNARLAQALARGLERLVASGEFQRAFHRHHAGLLARAAMERRTVLSLHNPLVSQLKLPVDPRLWWQPG